MVTLNKPLEVLSKKELFDLLPSVAKNVSYSYEDIVQELERRRMRREATRSFIVSIVALLIAGLSVLSGVFVATINHRNP